MANITRSTPNPAIMRIINPIVKFLVGRGIGPVGERLMVLHWTGKKTGKNYSTPVSRFEHNGQPFTKTRAGYKHNFIGGGPAELVLSGERLSYIGTVIDSPQLVGERLRNVLDEHGTKQGARSLSLSIDGDPTITELAEFAEADGLVVIEFQPTA